MSRKTRNILRKIFRIIKIFIKISIIIGIILGILNLGNNILNALDKEEQQENTKQIKNSNISSFKNLKPEPLANVGVAITTNIGIRYKLKQNISTSNIYNEVFDLKDILDNSQLVKKELITKNMLSIKEYFNYVKTDFNIMIKKSSNKKSTLDNIIKQLEIRYKNSAKNKELLNKQLDIIIERYKEVSSGLNEIKFKIDENYNNTNTNEINENINTYISLKAEESTLKIYTVFINNFLGAYNKIDSYNKLLLDTLINNKDIITKESYLVIPDSGDRLIDDFELIMSEEERKEKEEK